VAAPGASGPRERAILAQQLGSPGADFTPWQSPASPFLIGCPNGKKQDAAQNLVSWFHSEKGIYIAPSRVFMFDDLAENIQGFQGPQGHGMNAHQISCASRDPSDNGKLGLCGGRVEEINLAAGVTLCQR